jgi:hypothetical protein
MTTEQRRIAARESSRKWSTAHRKMLTEQQRTRRAAERQRRAIKQRPVVMRRTVYSSVLPGLIAMSLLGARVYR